MENKPICEIDKMGTKRWYLNGIPHREDGPAVEMADGTQIWCFKGNYHRLDGPAVEMADGSKEWWINGKIHREDGPAIIGADGDKEWWINGKLHRLCGTAIDYNGRKEWWINGYNVSTQIRKWATENNIDLDNLTDIDKALIKLVWFSYEE